MSEKLLAAIPIEICIYPKHLVYKTLSGELVVVTIMDGKISVMGNSISPVDLECIDLFEADSRSDFNWGIATCVISNNIKSLLKSCKHILRNGL